MKSLNTDILIIGAGPVGLMCAYLANLCGLQTIIIDKSDGPLQVGRADALNARTLQQLELIDMFNELYPLGKPCNTSSVWADGKFVSRQSNWWDELEGCLHKHFLMLGQSFLEKALDKRLSEISAPVWRNKTIKDIRITVNGCISSLSDDQTIKSRYVIGSDGSRSFVRNHFNIPFEITRPEIIWAVIDGIIETDFPKVPEIIVFQTDTSDVAWIPREGNLDRFYIRMDKADFCLNEVITKINRAMHPHKIQLKEIIWSSKFAVKESVAECFSIHEKVFLAGDACHIHSVNGGQGLNTGLGDAFNLIWKLNMVIRQKAPDSLLRTYEAERKPVALSVVSTSGELVRSTKYSANGTHAMDYVKIVERRAGNITGMGIRYGEKNLAGQRVHDFELNRQNQLKRLYSMLNYQKFSLLIFSDKDIRPKVPDYVQVIRINPAEYMNPLYDNLAILVRPDSYIEASAPLEDINTIFSR